MPRGGKRPGAGRKKGSATQKTRKVADRAAAEGITPLEVMLDAMRRLHKARKYGPAAAIAHNAAPYIHPRLAAITHKGDSEQPIRLVEEFVIVDANTPATPSPAP